VQESLLNTIEAAAAAGVDWIQLREKDLLGKGCAALTCEALQRVERASQGPGSELYATRILVNDRLDVALAERAGGVHLGENSLPVSEVKRLLSASPAARSLLGDFLVGVSCHSLESAKSAAAAGADYIFFGPVFSTPSKAAFGAPQGLDRLAEVCRSVSIPVLAIGGITLANAAACFATGAAGLAAIRLFQASENLTLVVKALRDLGF
jgi:thiamine-phosphate pyrophosphorylase